MDDIWHHRFLELAKHVSTWSKDPSTKVGAVAINPNDRQLLSIGYNGFPRGIEDTEERLNDRSKKYPLIVHAEMNCIYNATRNGVSLEDSTLYVYGLPICEQCALGVVQTGIKMVVMPKLENTPEKWLNSFENTRKVFAEANIAIMRIAL